MNSSEDLFIFQNNEIIYNTKNNVDVYTTLKAKNEYIEKERMLGEMSYNCCFLFENKVFLGADSRETNIDKTYNDNFRKIFINRKEKMIWSMTGLIKTNNLNYVNLVNNVLNEPNVPFSDKFNIIESLMNGATDLTYKQNLFKDSRFNLIINFINNNNLWIYVFESLNGNTIIKRTNSAPYYIATGVHADKIHKLGKNDMLWNDALLNFTDEVVVKEITNHINSIKRLNTYESKTVGGDICVATMDINGNIKTYINNIEKEF